MKIYCDESGYTGTDMLGSIQPYFVYAGVKLDDVLSAEIKDYIYLNYKIQNGEIKGKNFVKSPQGRKVIKYIFENYSKHARVVFHDKKYTLSARIIEYGIEPYLTSNYQFYVTKFNEFLATGLYASFITKDVSAERLFKEFLLILKGKKSFEESELKELNAENAVVDWVIKTSMHDPEIIINEIAEEGKVEKWILDLTMTSLLGILTDWSKNEEQLEVICDNSKVFVDNPVFDNFNDIGLSNARAEFLGVPLGFGLKKKIETGDSKEFFGLQIADLFSSTVFYCLNNKETEFSKSILRIVLKDCICTPQSFCVMPKTKPNLYEFEKNKPLYLTMMQSIGDELNN